MAVGGSGVCVAVGGFSVAVGGREVAVGGIGVGEAVAALEQAALVTTNDSMTRMIAARGDIFSINDFSKTGVVKNRRRRRFL